MIKKTSCFDTDLSDGRLTVTIHGEIDHHGAVAMLSLIHIDVYKRQVSGIVVIVTRDTYHAVPCACHLIVNIGGVVKIRCNIRCAVCNLK